MEPGSFNLSMKIIGLACNLILTMPVKRPVNNYVGYYRSAWEEFYFRRIVDYERGGIFQAVCSNLYQPFFSNLAAGCMNQKNNLSPSIQTIICIKNPR